MIKLYSKNSSEFSGEPSEQTIKFLLDFSKSLKIIKNKRNSFFELNLN